MTENERHPGDEQHEDADRLDELLDEALRLTFPASDPIAIHIEPPTAPAPRPGGGRTPGDDDGAGQ